MRHPIDAPLDKWICPITGEPFKQSWSDKEVFDCCNSCKPDAPSIGQRLYDLNAERAQSTTKGTER